LQAIKLVRREALDCGGQIEVGRGIISKLVGILFEERDLEVFGEALVTLACHHQLGYSWRTEARLLGHIAFWVRRGCRQEDQCPLLMATRRAALRLILSFDATSLEATIPFLSGCFGGREQNLLPLPLRLEAWWVLLTLCRRFWKAHPEKAPLPGLPLALARLAADPDPHLSAAALKFFQRHRERIPLGKSQAAVRELRESVCQGLPAARNCLSLLETLEHRTALLALSRVYFHHKTQPAIRDEALRALTRVAAGRVSLPVS